MQLLTWQLSLNVCIGQSHSLQEVIELCEKISGHSMEIHVNSEFVRANEVQILRG